MRLSLVTLLILLFFKCNFLTAQLAEPKQADVAVKTLIKKVMKYDSQTGQEKMIEQVIDTLDTEKETDNISGQKFVDIINDNEELPLLLAQVKTEADDNKTHYDYFSAYNLLPYLYKPILQKTKPTQDKFDIFDVLSSPHKRGNKYPIDQFSRHPVHKSPIISPIDLYIVTKQNPVAKYVTNDMQLASDDPALVKQAVLMLTAHVPELDINPESLKQNKQSQQKAQIFLADKLLKEGQYQEAFNYYSLAQNIPDEYADEKMAAHATYYKALVYYKYHNDLAIKEPPYKMISQLFESVSEKTKYPEYSIPAKIYLSTIYATGQKNVPQNTPRARELVEAARKEMIYVIHPQTQAKLKKFMENFEQEMRTSSGKNIE